MRHARLIILLLPLEGNLYAQKRVITVVGERHEPSTGRDNLNEKAKNNEIILLLEGQYKYPKSTSDYYTESTYVHSIAFLIASQLDVQRNFLQSLAEPDNLPPHFFSEDSPVGYQELLMQYINNPCFKKAFLTVCKKNESKEFLNFLLEFYTDSMEFLISQTRKTKPIYTGDNSTNAQFIEYMLTNTLLELINNPKYEKEYLKEFPQITPPKEYKENIRKYLSADLLVAAHTGEYSYINNLSSLLEKTIVIDWRNQIIFEGIKNTLENNTTNTKPLYIIVGDSHRKGLLELLKTNLSNLFEIKYKSIVSVARPSKSVTIDKDVPYAEKEPNNIWTVERITALYDKVINANETPLTINDVCEIVDYVEFLLNSEKETGIKVNYNKCTTLINSAKNSENIKDVSAVTQQKLSSVEAKLLKATSSSYTLPNMVIDEAKLMDNLKEYSGRAKEESASMEELETLAIKTLSAAMRNRTAGLKDAEMLIGENGFLYYYLGKVTDPAQAGVFLIMSDFAKTKTNLVEKANTFALNECLIKYDEKVKELKTKFKDFDFDFNTWVKENRSKGPDTREREIRL